MRLILMAAGLRHWPMIDLKYILEGGMNYASVGGLI